MSDTYSAQPDDNTAAKPQPAAPSDPGAIDQGMRDAGASIADAFNKANAGTQQPQETAPSAPQPPAPVIPPPPAPIPGVYSPEKEQEAMQLAGMIKDPMERLRVQGRIKQEYANDAVADGIAGKARELAKEQAVGDYTHAMIQLTRDPKASYQVKTAVAQKLIDTALKDPRLAYGDIAEKLMKNMQQLAGIEDTTQLGPGYSTALEGIYNGKISSVDQLLGMHVNHQLTNAGFTAAMREYQARDKPEARVAAEKQVLAFDRAKNTIFRNLQESDPTTGLHSKPSAKQYEKFNDVQSTVLNQVEAAKGDLKQISDILSPKNVDELIEQTYPWYERHLDYVNNGAPANVGGVTIPPFVANDTKSQTAYRDIYLAPPFAANPKTQKLEPIPPKGWQMAVNSLLSNPTEANKTAFTARFKVDADRVLSAVKTVPVPPATAPPPVVTPVAQEPAPPGSFLGARPPHEYLHEIGKEAVDKALQSMPAMHLKAPEAYLRQLFGLSPAQEAKK